MRRLILAVLLVGAPTVGAIVGFSSDQRPAHLAARALVVAAVALAVGLGLFELAGRQDQNPTRKKLGYLNLLLGADGRISTSKTIVAVWTLVFGAALALVSGLVWFADFSSKDAFGNNWDAYFLLLGGPFAAAVAAKGIVTSRLNDASYAKTATSAASKTVVSGASTPVSDPAAANATPSASQIVNDDNGEMALVDTQYTLFTAVAVIFFVGALVNNLVRYATGAAPASAAVALPDIPSALIGLTSVAAATYVGHKAVQTTQAPTTTTATTTTTTAARPLTPGVSVAGHADGQPVGMEFRVEVIEGHDAGR